MDATESPSDSQQSLRLSKSGWESSKDEVDENSMILRAAGKGCRQLA